MSAAEKYGRSVESMPAQTLSQARDAGQTLADKGVTMQSAQGIGSPAPTPAMKYAPQTATETMGRSLSQSAPGRSL